MNTTSLGKLVARAGLGILKAASLLILSSVVSGQLRNDTNRATEKIVQVVRYTTNRIHAKKSKVA